MHPPEPRMARDDTGFRVPGYVIPAATDNETPDLRGRLPTHLRVERVWITLSATAGHMERRDGKTVA